MTAGPSACAKTCRMLDLSGRATLSQNLPAALDQGRSLPDAGLNVWLRQKPPFRFRDHAATVLMTESGWNAVVAVFSLFGHNRKMAANVNVEHVRWALEELSDEREQVRLWLSDGSVGKEVSSFVEAHCSLFDESGLGDALEKNSTGLGEKIDSQLVLLGTLLRGIDSRRAPQDIVADPLMGRVRAAAAETLKALQT